MILGIYGSGGSGCELKDIAELMGLWSELVFVDDTVEMGMYKDIQRMPFETFCQTYEAMNAEMVIAQGEPEHKIALYNKVRKRGYSFAKLIHPQSYVSPSARLGMGAVIQEGVFISCDVVIGDNSHILQKAIVGHDCIIHEHCQISPGVALGGRVEVGEGTFIGLNASIKERLIIGTGSIVGMGAVVFQDIPDNVITLGNPARLVKHRNESRAFGDFVTEIVDLKNGMNNLERYDRIFIKCFGILKEQLDGLKYKSIPAWNSVGHMEMIAELENEFKFTMNAEDIMDFDSYEKGKEILADYYGVGF